MMGSILARILVCSAVVLSARAAFAVEGFSATDLIDTDQNQALVQGLQADLSLDRSALSPFYYKLAAVHFIVGSNGQTFDTPDNDFSDPTGDYCKRYGFTVTSCPSGLFNQACPYNDKIYDRCCDSAYIYSASSCPAPKKLSSDICGGKHRCYCDPTQYPYATCNAPQIKGTACSDESGTRYASCTCPADNNGPWGCMEYYAAPCNSVCKTPWPDNCRNRPHNDRDYGCAKWWEDCSSKCEIPYTDNCRNRNAVSAPYGCQQWWYDCSSKCEIPYTDGCRNHNAVISSCPTNATCQTFSDCSSKISSWSCNSGYEKSGDRCVSSHKHNYVCENGYVLHNDWIYGNPAPGQRAARCSSCGAYSYDITCYERCNYYDGYIYNDYDYGGRTYSCCCSDSGSNGDFDPGCCSYN